MMHFYDVVFRSYETDGTGYKVTATSASAAVCQVLRALGKIDRLTHLQFGMETGALHFVGTYEETVRRARSLLAYRPDGCSLNMQTTISHPAGFVSLEGHGAATRYTEFLSIHQNVNPR